MVDSARSQELRGNEGNTRLSREVTVNDYANLVKQANREAIAKFVYARFVERYILPMKHVERSYKNGFSILANSCLMIETLQCFREGLKDSTRQSRDLFERFFTEEARQGGELGSFAEVSEDFYRDVRCGILHQGETRGGWRISRKGALLDKQSKTINAARFLKAVDGSLQRYCETLRHEKWESPPWKMLREKMDAVCDNCKRTNR